MGPLAQPGQRRGQDAVRRDNGDSAFAGVKSSSILEGEQALNAALTPDPGGLKSTERNTEIGGQSIVFHRAGSYLTCDRVGPIHIVGEDRTCEAVVAFIRDQTTFLPF